MLAAFRIKRSRSCLVLLACLLCCRGLFGQTGRNDTLVVLDDPTFLGLKADSIPFERVEILDGRFDTVTFRMEESGRYPAVRETFSLSTRTAISRYYEKVLGKVKYKGNKVLLLHITQLRIGNSFAVLRRAGNKVGVRWEPVRYTIQFCGEAYLQVTPGRYRKIMNVDYHLRMTSEGWTANQDYLPWLLDRILTAAASLDGRSQAGRSGMPHKIWAWGDRKYFDFVHEPGDLPIAGIDRPVTEKWAGYPIVRHPPGGSGAYLNFDDFREARLTQGPVKMQFDGRDSLYRLQDGPFAPVVIKVKGIRRLFCWPYAIADSSGLYVNLLRKNQYLKVTPSANTFSFRIPDSLPDMYALLSKDCSGAARAPGTIVPSENLVAGLASAAAVSVTQVATNPHPPSKNVRDEGKEKAQYRNCLIDMSSGDILYY